MKSMYILSICMLIIMSVGAIGNIPESSTGGGSSGGGCINCTEIFFIDANLEQAIRDANGYGGDSTGPIYTDDVEDIDFLDIREKEIQSLSGIENLVNLNILYAPSNHISDLTPIESLTLERLEISDNPIADFSPITTQQSLKKIWLGDLSITDISFLSLLDELEFIFLSSNKINNIDVLHDMFNLNKLYLAGNDINDISALQNLIELREIFIGGNEISDLSQLQNLNNLETLHIWNNNITDISPITNLESLGELDIGHNPISNIEDITDLSETLHALDISSVGITNIEFLEELYLLNDIDLASNDIEDFTPLYSLDNLTAIRVGNMDIDIELDFLNNLQLTNLQIIEMELDNIDFINLPDLKYLGLSNNKIKSLGFLDNFTSLESLNIEHNSINDISQLAEKPLNWLMFWGNPNIPLNQETCDFINQIVDNTRDVYYDQEINKYCFGPREIVALSVPPQTIGDYELIEEKFEVECPYNFEFEVDNTICAEITHYTYENDNETITASIYWTYQGFNDFKNLILETDEKIETFLQNTFIVETIKLTWFSNELMILVEKEVDVNLGDNLVSQWFYESYLPVEETEAEECSVCYEECDAETNECIILCEENANNCLVEEEPDLEGFVCPAYIDGIGINQIDFIKQTAIADNTFANGWLYEFYITVPNNEDKISLKMDDWINGNNIIETENNVKLVYNNQEYEITNSFLQEFIAKDEHPNCPGRQVSFQVLVKLPENTEFGFYNTGYGIRSLPSILIEQDIGEFEYFGDYEVFERCEYLDNANCLLHGTEYRFNDIDIFFSLEQHENIFENKEFLESILTKYWDIGNNIWEVESLKGEEIIILGSEKVDTAPLHIFWPSNDNIIAIELRVDTTKIQEVDLEYFLETYLKKYPSSFNTSTFPEGNEFLDNFICNNCFDTSELYNIGESTSIYFADEEYVITLNNISSNQAEFTIFSASLPEIVNTQMLNIRDTSIIFSNVDPFSELQIELINILDEGGAIFGFRAFGEE